MAKKPLAVNKEGLYTNALFNLSRYEGDLWQAEKQWYIDLLSGVNGSRYKFVSPLAKGGQGLLIVCEDTRAANAQVVIKFALIDLLQKDEFWQKIALWKKKKRGIPPNPLKLGKTELAARFQRGILLQMQVNKIVSCENLRGIGYTPAVLDISNEPHKLWYVMEFCPLEDLIVWASHASFREKAEMVHKILLFVEKALHAYSIVHSDLKPDNWLVSDVPHLMDFNIGKNMGVVERVTGRASCQGSLLYSSDNQLRNFAGRGYKDDVYTLALTIWCVFLGKEPDCKHDIRFLRLRSFYDTEKVFDPDAAFVDENGNTVTELIDIFRKAISVSEGCYTDIAEMRRDYERWLAKLRKPVISVAAPAVQQRNLQIDWQFLQEQTKNYRFRDAVLARFRQMEATDETNNDPND